MAVEFKRFVLRIIWTLHLIFLKGSCLVHGCQPGEEEGLNSFLWTVRNDPPSYFFGTIHVPYSRVWSYIPENVKDAFHRADSVYFELDLTDSSTLSALSDCQMLPAGQSLDSLLPADLFSRLENHLDRIRQRIHGWMTEDQKGRGIYAEYLFKAITGDWQRKRPIWVMLMVNSLTEADVQARGMPVLDLYLAREAGRLSKRAGAVEKVEDQCGPLNQLDLSQVIFALNRTLSQHEQTVDLSYSTNELIDLYNCGDLSSLLLTPNTAHVPNMVDDLLAPADMRTATYIDSYFREELLYKRNHRMAERVMRLMADHPKRSYFFAFGAGHFMGNDTVLDLLRGQGYDVEHTLPQQELYLGKHRHEHGGDRGVVTDSEHLRRPHFKDLWVRLEASSFAPNHFFPLVDTSTSMLTSSSNQSETSLHWTLLFALLMRTLLSLV